MRPMPRSISAWETTTCELPSPERRLDKPTNVMPSCSQHRNLSRDLPLQTFQ